MSSTISAHLRPFGKDPGVIAMIDDDETDWKVLTIALDDDKAQILSTK